MPKIRFAAVGALCLLVVSLESGMIQAASADATLIVRLPKTQTPAKSITVAAVAAETGDVLARQTTTSASSQMALTVRAVAQVVVVEWLLSDSTKVNGHSRVLRPVDGGMLTVDVAPRPAQGKSFVMMRAAYRLPGSVRSAAAAEDGAAAQGGTAAQRGAMRIGVPADGFTVTGLDVSSAAVARAVVTDLINGADCYGEDGGFVIVETDPAALAAIQAEIDLSNSAVGDPATRMTSRYVAPSRSVGGSWSSDGTNLTVTLRVVDAQGKQVLSKSATGPLSQLDAIDARAARAVAAALSSCPARGSWSGTVTYSRTTASYWQTSRETSSLKTTQWSESNSIYYARITITAGTSPIAGFAQLQSTAIVATSNQDGLGMHQVDSQGCSVRGPKVLDVNTTSSKDSSGSLTQALRGTLSISQDGSYRVSLEEPGEVVQQGMRSNVATSTGWCDPEKAKANNYSRSEPMTNQVTFPEGSRGGLTITGHVDPKNPDTLEGTFTEKAPASPNGPSSRSGETVITWRLRRAPAPGKK